MKQSLTLFLIVLGTLGYSQKWVLQWSDEFNDNKLDKKIWNIETGNGQGGWGCGQIDYSTGRKKNIEESDSSLKIRIHKENLEGFHYTSGRINSKNKFYAKYGKIEARLKIPGGKGIGSAFWMMPQFDKYGGWPKSGEIDIMETNGDGPYTNYGTVHYEKWDSHQFSGKKIMIPETHSLITEYHRYGIIWNEKSLSWFLDDSIYNTIDLTKSIDKRFPFNEAFYIILSVGVGSDFSGKIIEDNILPQSLELDYVRVYKGYYEPNLVKAFTTDDGKSVVLNFSEKLSNQTDMMKGFNIIRNNGEEVKINQIKFLDDSKKSLLFSLYSFIDKKDTGIYLTYHDGMILTEDSMKLNSISRASIFNMVLGAAPVILSAVAEDEYKINLILNKELNKNLKIEPTEFHLVINGEPINIKKIEMQNQQLLMTPEKPVIIEDKVFVNYTGSSVTSTDDGRLIPFTNKKITNNVQKRYSIPGNIEAENFSDMKGISVEDCRDLDKGKNVGFIDTDDYMDYRVKVENSGMYELNVRYSCHEVGGIIELQDVSTNQSLSTIEIKTATEGWQKWKTLKTTVQLTEGLHTFRFFAQNGGFNLNYFYFKKIEDNR